MFAHGIAFVHFYNAEHVVSAIAKFLANILGEGEKWDKMGDGRRRERVGEKGEGMEGKGRVWRSGQWECTKNSPKTTYLPFEDAPREPRVIIFRKLFSRAKFASQIICRYTASFRSYKA